MRRHKGRRVHFPKRGDDFRTTSESPPPLQSEGQPEVQHTGFVIEEIDEEIEAESGDISSRTTLPWKTRPASERQGQASKKNSFPVTRNWGSRPTGERIRMAATNPSIPTLFTTLPPIRDLYQTHTSVVQDETVQTCLPFLSNPLSCNSHGIPRLRRIKHINFLHQSLEPLPAPYTAADASRPWLLYWALSGLSTMGVDVSRYRERVVETVRTMQNPTGGFGGGGGQLSHLAPSYAVILSLGIVGCAGNVGDDVLRETMAVVDRRGMWEWLGRLKCPDGGFQMCEGGEEDLRGAYCAAVIISLLSLPLTMPPRPSQSVSSASPLSPRTLPPSIKLFTDLLPEYLSRCQTFEGGISARPDAEAHGAYAFCALACLSILFSPTEIVTKSLLDIPALISWLSARQYSPEGGFAGRTNKLVDGCYSHWVGGCWPIIEAALSTSSPEGRGRGRGVLYSREALIRYIFCCCQDSGNRGGLRDKPGKSSDTYHTCYVLAGLSSAMYQNHYNPPSSNHSLDATNNNNLTAPYSWTGTPYSWEGDSGAAGKEKGVGVDEVQVFDDGDWLEWVHPVFVVPRGVAERVRGCFCGGRDVWGEER